MKKKKGKKKVFKKLKEKISKKKNDSLRKKFLVFFDD